LGFVSGNGVGDASGTGTADGQTGSEPRELGPRAGTDPHAQTPDPGSDTSGDRDRSQERVRGPARAPFQESRRDNDAVREPPKQVTNTPERTRQGAGAREVVAVRQPALSLLFVLLLVLGLLGAGLLAWQLYLLRAQMSDLRAAAAQNDKIADAAGRLADAATQANEIAGQSLASATRPWIGVDAVEASPFEVGQPLNIEVRVRNSGRTPSSDVQGLFLVYISPPNNPPALLADQCASCVRSVLLPEGVVSYKLSVRDSVMTADEVQRIRDGKDTMWIVGRLDYHDGEGEAHTTRSCLYYRSTGIASFTACSSGNAAN
jgi:hypothetical protein